jgi:hypothetical protein
MPKICKTVIIFVTQQVLDPVEQWVTQSQQQCHQYPWWDPRGLVCWFVTTLVKIIVWVAREILVPISKTICYFVSFLIGGFLLPFAAAIGPSAYNWVSVYFLNGTSVTIGPKVDTPSGFIDYYFTCNCKNFVEKQIVISIPQNDDAKALELAKAQCKTECG